MKKTTLLLFTFCLALLKAQAQVETETIHFENYILETDNDFVNNFKFSENTNEVSMGQVLDGGIGFGIVPEEYGALEPSNSIDWANDTFVYRSNYKNVLGEVLETSISFKYNTDLISEGDNQKAITLFLIGETNNHDVGVFINEDQTLAITSFNYADNTQLSLENDTWYKLVVKYQSTGEGDAEDGVYVNAEVFDLGALGIEIPASIGNHTATISDIDLINSSEFEVHLSASKDGGSEFLDNFIFKGTKGSSNFETLGLDDYYEPLSEVIMYPNPVGDILTIKSEAEIKNVEIIDLTGRAIITVKELNIDVSKLLGGNYIVKANFSNGEISEKTIIKLD